MYQKKEKHFMQKMICKSSNWQHVQRLKITILDANWQLFRLERIAKCSYFILSTQNIKIDWFVMKIKKFLLPIWWYNRGSFPLGNKYFVVFILTGFKNRSDRHLLRIITSSRATLWHSPVRPNGLWWPCLWDTIKSDTSLEGLLPFQ